METLADKLKRILHVKELEITIRRKRRQDPRPPDPLHFASKAEIRWRMRAHPYAITVVAQGHHFKANNLRELDQILTYFTDYHKERANRRA